MEFHGVATKAEAERQIHAMLEEPSACVGKHSRSRRRRGRAHGRAGGVRAGAITLLADEDLV
jgi:hypothetical protein